MCIIAAKPAGVALPKDEYIRNMWDGNRDGAGIMYVLNGKVRIEKGFMKYKAFVDALERIKTIVDPVATPIVMHFRITTHGGTKPENTHPFPITDNLGALRKLIGNTDIGVAHNGIIPITPRKGISDTMEYIVSQLAPLKRALPRFCENPHAMQMVENAIGSKMAFLTKEGRLYTIGKFIEDEGVLYSNTSYEGWFYRSRSLGYGWEWDEDRDWFGYATGKTSSPGGSGSKGSTDGKLSKDRAPFDIEEPHADMLMWLDDTDFVRFEDGELIEGTEFLIDRDGRVYWYDFESDAACRVENVSARNAQGLPVRYNEDLAEYTVVSDVIW